MADRNLCAGLVVWEEAEGVGIFDPRIHLDDRQTEAAGMIDSRRSARRAVTTRPSTGLPMS